MTKGSSANVAAPSESFELNSDNRAVGSPSKKADPSQTDAPVNVQLSRDVAAQLAAKIEQAAREARYWRAIEPYLKRRAA